jgi:hypothetical protein
MKRLTCAVVAASTALIADAKVIKTADGRKTKIETPKHVHLGRDDDLCLFKNFDDSWCFEATPPMVQAGWEWS